MSPEEMKSLRALAEQAAPGPWIVVECGRKSGPVAPDDNHDGRGWLALHEANEGVTAAELVAQAGAHLARIVEARGHVPSPPLPSGWCSECLSPPGYQCSQACVENTQGARRVR